MPYWVAGKAHPGDPRHGTRWADPVEVDLAQKALRDLATKFNRITLVPAPRQSFDSHKIRVQAEANPGWYRKFVEGRWSRRGCNVKRARVERALRRVAESGVVRRNGYESRLLGVLQEEAGRSR